MKFVDEALITVQSGDGGAGCVSLRRERFVPKGGPDGGDGGKGGDVIMTATDRKSTLYDFHFQHRFKAEKGRGGGGKQMTGRKGRDVEIEVPVGTLALDPETGEVAFDFTEPGQVFIAARGGIGGKGNKHFATSTNRTPRFAQPGTPGESRTLKLELKLLADIGLVGLPNAGKSTLISILSAARPKIADYPFTTLTPTLGVVRVGDTEPFVVADIPGLIEGASQGAGLGIQFLKHVERTRALVHLIDASDVDLEDPLAPFNTVNTELSSYSEDLIRKRQLVVLNKIDLPEAKEAVERFREALPDREVLTISCATREGIDRLAGKLLELLRSAK